MALNIDCESLRSFLAFYLILLFFFSTTSSLLLTIALSSYNRKQLPLYAISQWHCLSLRAKASLGWF